MYLNVIKNHAVFLIPIFSLFSIPTCFFRCFS